MKKIYKFSKITTFLFIIFFMWGLIIYKNAPVYFIIGISILLIVSLWEMGTSVKYDNSSLYLKFPFFKTTKIDYKDIIIIGKKGKKGRYVIYRKSEYNYPIEAYFQKDKIKEINEYIIKENSCRQDKQ